MQGLATHRFTADDYERMIETGILGADDHVELLNGEIVDMSPTGPWHASVLTRLIDLLSPLCPKRALRYAQSTVNLGTHSGPEPDLAIVKPRDDYYAAQRPGPNDIFLIIEIARTSAARDRQVKQLIYADAGIGEYWLIDAADDAVHVYRRPDGGRYHVVQRYPRGSHLTPSAFPDFVVAVHDILGPAVNGE